MIKYCKILSKYSKSRPGGLPGGQARRSSRNASSWAVLLRMWSSPPGGLCVSVYVYLCVCLCVCVCVGGGFICLCVSVGLFCVFYPCLCGLLYASISFKCVYKCLFSMFVCS